VVILITTLSLTLLLSTEIHAGDAQSPTTLLQGLETYQSPQHCRECHLDEFRAWSHTTHAEASFDPVFQVALQKVAEPGECFACHTTGYDTVTGRFVLAGVTCEACHGPYRPGHPEESMVIAASEELCGTCHENTLVEWRTSEHAREGVSCVDCHEVHTQKTRTAENTNALCAGCHKEQTQDLTHMSHRHDETAVHCVDCHLASPDKETAAPGGAVVTGHTFTVFLSTCSDCHPGTMILTPAPSPSADAQP
jgi:predicted CXXCH cytochrome family protein